jgi:hypothetical protein
MTWERLESGATGRHPGGGGPRVPGGAFPSSEESRPTSVSAGRRRWYGGGVASLQTPKFRRTPELMFCVLLAGDAAVREE